MVPAWTVKYHCVICVKCGLWCTTCTRSFYCHMCNLVGVDVHSVYYVHVWVVLLVYE